MEQKRILKPAGSLKKLVDVGKKPSRVLGSVERWLLAAPRDTSRASDVIHPSAMIKSDWCHRAAYYMLQGNPPAPPKSQASMKRLLTFEEGHRIHDRWQTWFWKMGKLHGLWRCSDCYKSYGSKRDFWETSPSVCPYCDSKELAYREVPVSSPEHGISGHADGWLKDFGDDLLLEVKSVGEGSFVWEDRAYWEENGKDFKKAWANLKAPFQTHVMQAQVYMKLLEIMFKGTDVPTPQEALFIYESKADQEVKEFVVPKSDFGITELFDASKSILNAVKANKAPVCNVSTTGACYQCEVYNDN